MKRRYLIVFVFFLCACTQGSGKEPVVTELPLPTINATQELLVNNIKTSYSTGIHASEFSCEKCHATRQGAVAKQLAWTDEGTGQVETVSSANVLCGKCHAEQIKGKESKDTTQFAHSDFECTNCHNAHSLQAGCTSTGCHTDIKNIRLAQVEKPSFHTGLGDPDSYMCGGTACHDLAKQVANTPVYHQPTHKNVPCYVCHDVSGMMVIMGDDQSWATVIDSGQGNGAELLPQVSHTIGLDVQCQKCHYSSNAWSLDEILPEN
jgi:hypothetical protein